MAVKLGIGGKRQWLVKQVDDVRVRATGKAVPLPEPGNITSDPGPLPSPARIISAYFEVQLSSESSGLHCRMVPMTKSAVSSGMRTMISRPCMAHHRLEGDRTHQHIC